MSIHLFFVNLVKKLNQNKFFKFISSVRLAVPLMLVLCILVAYGTVVESNYNAEYASMAIYKTDWFGAFLVLLWINIFSAMLSRYPYKLHQTGFVITHIGMCLLLLGGYITNMHGIDGQLAIQEGQINSNVVLPNLMVGYQFEGSPTAQSIKFKKSLFERSQSGLSSINDEIGHLFEIKKYIPFAQAEKVYKSDVDSAASKEVALSFILKSNFFNVNEWLHSSNNPVMQLGPATLKLVVANDISGAPQVSGSAKIKNKKREVNSVPSETRAPSAAAEPVLEISDAGSSAVIKNIPLKELQKKPIQVQGAKITITRAYKNAMVAENKIIENDNATESNPAVELLIEKDGKNFREVVYAKYRGFSLNKDGVFNLKFSLNDPTVADIKSQPHGGATAAAENIDPAHGQDAADSAGMVAPASAMMGGNTVEFSVNPNDRTKARITLYKSGKVVMSEILSEGQSLQTPWMGMKVFLGTIQVGASQATEVTAINPVKAGQLPPSALLISTSQNSKEDFWLTEGEQKNIQIAGKNAVIYFGRQTIDLPFDVKLEKFTKVDYPGTQTPMSYESLVQIGKTGIIKKISMNDPLKVQGYTIYQASYVMDPSSPVMSIFSVNQDPGRPLKYLGSLIMALGIITYTLMRSRVWKLWLERKSKNA